MPDNTRHKFTGSYERDLETNLDYAQARYYAAAHGRFTSPDPFWKDSDIVDPQSWNKYAYVRNNPLRYVDPTGEKATVKIQTDEDKKTGTITITASIAIYSQGNSNFTQEQLNQAKAAIESSIEGAWSGTFEQDGIIYTVTTDVNVQVYGSQGDATNSGAQNVIGISAGDAIPGRAISVVNQRSFWSSDSGPDTGTWKFDRVVNGRQAAHEFTHILGADNTGNRANVSFSPYIGDIDPVSKYGNATRFDYRHALGGITNDHREGSRPIIPVKIYGPNPSAIYGRGERQSRTTSRIVVYR